MTKPSKVRKIFDELLQVFGHETPEHELLSYASIIVDASVDTLTNGGIYHHPGRTPLCELPTYEIFNRWSWELVDSHYHDAREHFDDHQDDYLAHVPDNIKWQELLLTSKDSFHSPAM